jgi:glutathione S-transferase
MTMELVVAENCPFCHRCLLVLLEKGVPFKLTQIDLLNKAQFKHLLSPYGRVPVLLHEGRTIYESSVINECLEEILPNPTLLPQDAGRKATARFWIDFCNTRFMPGYFDLLNERNPGQRGPLRTALMGHLQLIETVGLVSVSKAEPYWMGRDVTLVDYAFYPFFERFVSVETYRDITVPADFERHTGDGMLRHPSFKAVTDPK